MEELRQKFLNAILNTEFGTEIKLNDGDYATAEEILALACCYITKAFLINYATWVINNQELSEKLINNYMQFLATPQTK